MILDKKYLNSVKKISNCTNSLCSYGVAIDDFESSTIYFDENDTLKREMNFANEEQMVRINLEGLEKDF